VGFNAINWMAAVASGLALLLIVFAQRVSPHR
jgi:hypothetical protein